MSEPNAPAARILDRGYRRYNGPRTGVRGAVQTVWWQSFQRALGLRRTVWAKVLPIAAVLIAYVPAVVFIGVIALFPSPEAGDALDLPSYGEYYSFVAAALILFVAFVAPEILCPDRRTGMIGIYLASPLTRDSYLLAKALATLTVLSLVTLGPTLLMLVANILQGVGPDGPAGVAATTLRIIVAGAMLALLFTSVSMGVSALTDRKAFATAALLILLVVSPIFLAILVEVAGLPDGFQGLNLIAGPFGLVQLIHGERVDVEGLTLPSAIAGVAVWVVVGLGAARLRYHSLQVTR